MKPSLDSHEIFIVHNAGRDASFACFQQGKVAFSARGWDSMNQNFLFLSEVIEWMSN